MGLFDNFPYTNFHELNLDWILKALKQIEDLMNQFVSLNTIKYANPLEWNITTQYSKNTVVIDASTGIAYISTDNVPAGADISNTDYWTKVFDLSPFIAGGSSNFAINYESEITYHATMITPAGRWVVWNNKLYIATEDIYVGDTYIVDGNIERKTVEDFFIQLRTALQTEATTRGVTDTALGGRIDQEILDRQAADTTLGGRIDQEILDRQAADTALGGRIDQEILDRQAADTAVNRRINNLKIKNALDYGVTADGVTDDYTALQSWLNDLSPYDVGYLPSGTYITSGTLQIPNIDDITIIGTPTSHIIGTFAGGDILMAGGATRHRNLTIDGIKITSNILKTSGAAIHIIGYQNKSTIKNVEIGNYNGPNNLYDGIIFEHTNVTYLDTFNIYCTHDGVLIHGGANNSNPDSSDLFLNNGFVIYATNDVHVAGGFGGLYVQNTLLFGGTNGLLIDNAYCLQGNREIILSNTTCIDGCNNALIYANETISTGIFISCSAFLSGAGYYADPSIQPYAANIKIQSLPYGNFNIHNCICKASTQNGIWINDTTTKVFISETTQICNHVVGVNNPNNSQMVYCHAIMNDNTTNFYGTYNPAITPYTGT